jgi:hypothetical protein
MEATCTLTDTQLRCALRRFVSKEFGTGLLIEEMVIERGAARIDFALLSDQLSGFEIKSDFDSPRRFFNQIHAYNRVFDAIYLVCSANKAEEMRQCIPSWWGLLIADESDSDHRLHVHRIATLNEHRDPLSLALLLRRNEILSIFERGLGDTAPARASKHQLQDQLASSLSFPQLTSLVLEALRSRHSLSTSA